MKAKSTGFTLIEVMVTVVIVAILAGVAFPSYRNYAIRGKIPEATAGLSANRVKMEQWFQDNRKYTGGPVAGSSTSKYFTFGGTATDTGYTLTATGTAAMAGFAYSIDQTGAKASTVTGVSGWDGSFPCWVTKQGGQC